MRADNNNVDIDREMLRLGETSFSYSMIGQLLRGKFRTLASAINEGRG
jgi:flagellar basal body rod protein FlgB